MKKKISELRPTERFVINVRIAKGVNVNCHYIRGKYKNQHGRYQIMLVHVQLFIDRMLIAASNIPDNRELFYEDVEVECI